MEKVIKSVDYRGYVIRHVHLETAGGVVRTKQKVTPSYEQWQILKNEKSIDKATSEDQAKAKVDQLLNDGR